jgi:hypothetical protein
MLKVEKLEALGGRVVRCDEPIGELGISSYDRLRELISAGKTEQSLQFIDYLQNEWKWLHDISCQWAAIDCDYVAKHYGEEEIPKFLRYAKEKLDLSMYRGYPKVSIMDSIRTLAEAWRAHRTGPGERGTFKVWEEKDRYIIEGDPCGSGGRMRRKGELDGIAPITGPPLNLGVTSKPYDWSWSKKGVPYYCAHCCVWTEQVPIEKTGVPLRVVDYQDDPEAPCRFLFYKQPHDIPEEYYTRIGKKKPEW